MNEIIKAHVIKHNLEKGWDTSEESIIETIRDGGKHVWSGNDKPRRWWTDCFTVVDVGGMLIGFDDAKTTGDDSPTDKGWDFNPESICEVTAKEVVKTVYERKA